MHSASDLVNFFFEVYELKFLKECAYSSLIINQSINQSTNQPDVIENVTSVWVETLKISKNRITEIFLCAPKVPTPDWKCKKSLRRRALRSTLL